MKNQGVYENHEMMENDMTKTHDNDRVDRENIIMNMMGRLGGGGGATPPTC